MQPKISVFIATSLDGFIARKDGSLDWLNRANASVPKGEDSGYQAFMDSVDTLVIGENYFRASTHFRRMALRRKKGRCHDK